MRKEKEEGGKEVVKLDRRRSREERKMKKDERKILEKTRNSPK